MQAVSSADTTHVVRIMHVSGAEPAAEQRPPFVPPPSLLDSARQKGGDNFARKPTLLSVRFAGPAVFRQRSPPTRDERDDQRRRLGFRFERHATARDVAAADATTNAVPLDDCSKGLPAERPVVILSACASLLTTL
ncbi:hypothetical protein MRX96_025583 [Rhipicephalus microplus]